MAVVSCGKRQYRCNVDQNVKPSVKLQLLDPPANLQTSRHTAMAHVLHTSPMNIQCTQLPTLHLVTSLTTLLLDHLGQLLNLALGSEKSTELYIHQPFHLFIVQ